MIDEELLQELLARASSLYNDGDYTGAVGVWSEILQIDPGNTKAREGIQMSNLLLGDVQPAGVGAPTPEDGPAPADGGEAVAAALSPEEVDARLGEGIARVKALLAERRYPEALEGARSLAPIQPDSEPVQQLIEEAQQAFESAPFIEEHITLARELMAQERFAEAESHCLKVLALDGAHPQATALVRQLKDSGAGGSAPPAPGTTAAPAPPADPVPSASDEVADPAAFTDEDLAMPTGPPNSALPDDEGDRFDLEMLELPEPAGGSPAPEPIEEPTPAGSAQEYEIIEAREVVPPAVRVIRRADDKAGPTAEKLLEDLSGPPPAVAAETADWETELAQLNMNEGEKDLLGENTPSGDSSPADDEAGADLMSLLDDDLGGTAGAGEPAAAPDIASQEAIPLARPANTEDAPAPDAPGPPAAEGPAAPVESDAVPAAQPDVRPRPRAAARSMAPVRPHDAGRSPIPRLFAFLGLIILVAGAGIWWFYFQPVRPGGGKGDPGGAATPPAGSSAGAPSGADLTGPLPTPIGGPSKKAARQPAPEEATPAAASVTPPPAPPPRRAPAVEKTVTLTPDQVRRRIETHLTKGRRLMAKGKWRGVRDEMNAAMALDPFNLEVRDLADRAQEKITAEEKIQNEFDDARQLFNDRDYQNALWKLYRLPRDKSVGNVDRAIRNAWFNWAISSMKAGNNADALEKIGEALAVDPRDAQALKIQGFAGHYSERAKDGLYYEFANGYKLRSIEQR